MRRKLKRLPNRLREKRKAAGLSLEQLGERLDRSHQAIAQYETGAQPIPDEILMKAANFFQCSTEELLQPPAGESALNESTGLTSNVATLRMLEEERKEFAAAIRWLVQRAGSEDALEQLHKDVWSAKISRAAKHAVLAAVLTAQEEHHRARLGKN